MHFKSGNLGSDTFKRDNGMDFSYNFYLRGCPCESPSTLGPNFSGIPPKDLPTPPFPSIKIQQNKPSLQIIFNQVT